MLQRFYSVIQYTAFSPIRIGVLALLFMLFYTNIYADDAAAQTHQMHLKQHDFDSWTFTPKANDLIIITNSADISHAIYVTYPDGTVENLGVQTPGEVVTWRIPDKGVYLLKCWIHPIINEYMTVE